MKKPQETLREGRAFLEPVLHPHGFRFEYGGDGSGSGGPFAFGAYVNQERKLEIHFRQSLGLVTYHFGEASMDHEAYMQALLGKSGGNRYPGFSDDPLDGFRDLAYDLQTFAVSFLKGDSEQFMKCFAAAENSKKIPGIARLS